MNASRIARHVALVTLASLVISMTPSTAATVRAGQACKKANQVTQVAGKVNTTTFTCTKGANGKLTWKSTRTLSNEMVAYLKDCRNTINFVVGYSAGGATDIWARLLAKAIETETGAKVPVTNTPGAGGSLGINKVVAAKRTGCTIGNINLPSGLQYLRPTSTVTYTKESMALVARTGYSANVIVVNAKSSYKTIKDLIDASKTKKLNAGSDGPGSDDAIAYYDLQQKAKMTFNEVVTNGSADKVNALLNNQIDFFSGSITGVITQIKNDQFRAVCVLSDAKSVFLPTTPTCKEEGVDVISDNSWSVMMTNGVAEPRRQALEDLLLKIAANPAYVKANFDVSIAVRSLTSDALSEEWQRQASLYKSIINKL